MKNEAEKKGGAKAPRKHKKEWADTTRNERQNTRTAQLNAIAGKFGWFSEKTGKPSWSAFETACINGVAQPTPLAPDKSGVGSAAPAFTSTLTTTAPEAEQ